MYVCIFFFLEKDEQKDVRENELDVGVGEDKLLLVLFW